VPLNSTLAGQQLNFTVNVDITGLWAWMIQKQFTESWQMQNSFGMMNSFRDTFTFKKLYLETNPYLLAFSMLFMITHTLFSWLAFKNDVQFWRQNKSMKGLSARSMVYSFVCTIIISGYLLESRETSKLILFEIFLDLVLSGWKLTKAVQFTRKPSFPYLAVQDQTGYKESSTSKYDAIAVRYVCYVILPLFAGSTVRSLIYGKHRSWLSFILRTLAGGVYSFGFAMMTPQLYINYKLKSVEHLPWRALTYKAMNTFVDDVAALLIDMPLMYDFACNVVFCLCDHAFWWL
jgi:hypothetical protein